MLGIGGDSFGGSGGDIIIEKVAAGIYEIGIEVGIGGVFLKLSKTGVGVDFSGIVWH